MSDYHFEDENDLSKETIRLDHVNEQVKNYKKEQSETLPQGDTLTEPSAIKGIENAARGMRENLHLNQEIHETAEQKPNRAQESAPEKAASRKKPNGYAVMGILALGGAIVFILCFLLFFSNLKPGENLEMPEEPAPIVTTPAEEGRTVTALVESISASRELELFDIQNKTYLTLKANSDTKLANGAGEPFNFSALKIGDILEIQTDTEKTMAKEITYSEDVWTLANVSGITVNEEYKQLLISGKTYQYGPETIFSYHDAPIAASEIRELDVATLRGYQNYIYSVKVDTFHGYLVVKNSKDIQGGEMQIDEQKPFPLADAQEIPILEGAHKIAISGDNIETYRADIYITADEKFEINTQTKTGVLILKANITEYKLFINGAQIADPTEPLVLNLGEYTVRIEKDGYEPWEQKVILAEPSKEVEATLVQKTEAGALSVTTSPDGAYVYIDGVYVGVSPLETQVVFGEHRILVKKEGYLDVDSPITFRENNQVYSVMLTQQ